MAKKYKFTVLDYFYLIFGSFIVALAFQVFYLPNNIVSGGVTGLSIVANSLIGVSPALFQYAINIPLLVVCYVFFGKAAGNKTLIGSLLTPFYLQLMSGMEPWTTDPFLAAVFGGAITGIGLGIVYRAKASTGGTSIIAQLLNKYMGMTLGTATLIVDGVVIATGLLAFSLEIAMYSVVSLFVISKFIDIVQIGWNTQRNVFIISDKADEIRQEITSNIRRGVTNINVRGSFNQEDKHMLMTVIQEREFTFLKDLILNVDEEAFVVVMGATEVLGRGFSLTRNIEPLVEE